MAVVFNLVLPILAGIAILVMFYFILRAFGARSKASHQAYNVGKQEAIKSSRVNLVRAAIALIFALIILGAIGIRSSFPLRSPAVTATSAAPTPRPTIAATIAPTATERIITVEPSPTIPLPTATATPLPTATNTPAPLTATVNSGVGVWLRSTPGVETEQLEWLLDGTLVTILEGRENVDDLEWVQVQTESGAVGWVAADFIVINQPQ